VLDLAWPELARALPDQGLPRGVTEIAAPHAHGGGTTLALAALRAAQAQGDHVHGAWIEAADGPHLYAPELLVAGVDPSRLLVVRAPREALGRVAVKVLASGAFSLVTVALGAHVHGLGAGRARGEAGHEPRARTLDERAVRRMALAGEECGARVIVLSDTYFTHVPWPVSLRLEVTRLPESIHVKVARERRGRVGQAKSVPLRTRPLGPPTKAPSLSRVRVPSFEGELPTAASF